MRLSKSSCCYKSALHRTYVDLPIAPAVAKSAALLAELPFTRLHIISGKNSACAAPPYQFF
ncbi:hypothetical protein TAL182_CH02476 [Rhizobium sp. TAL182]|nr:hypothetical protein TAL182_CH02476 [Rhizobium sp. TAL182]